MPFNRFCKICFALLWCGAWHSANAQEPRPQPKLPETETIRLETKLALLNVGVFDKQGQPVSNLTQEAFTVYENGKPQSIAFFKREDEPISFGLLLDRSQSMGESNKLDQAIAVALAFLRAGNPRNEAFCLAFNEYVGELSDYTSDYDSIAKKLTLLKPDGGTALYDALLMGLDKLQTSRHQRRALIVITDGNDQHSKQKLSKLIRRAQQSDVQIYAVGFYSSLESEVYRDDNPVVEMIDGALAPNPKFVFRALAEETGAETFFPRSPKELEQTITAIAASLRRQYVLAYYLPETDAPIAYRQIEIKVRGNGLRVQTRRGFLPDEATELDKSKPLGKHAATLLSLDLKNTRITAASVIEAPALYQATFDQPIADWPQTKMHYADKGKYHIHEGIVLPLLPYLYRDFEASFTLNFLALANQMDFERFLKARATMASFTFRVNPTGYYNLSVTPAKNYRLVKVVEGKEHILISWRSDNLIRPSSVVKVRSIGNKIELFVNSVRLIEIKDSAHTAGQLGWSFQGSSMQLDDLIIKRLP